MIIFSESTKPQEFINSSRRTLRLVLAFFFSSQLKESEFIRAKAVESSLTSLREGKLGRFAAIPAAADGHTPHLSTYLLRVGSSSSAPLRSNNSFSRPLCVTLSPVVTRTPLDRLTDPSRIVNVV